MNNSNYNLEDGETSNTNPSFDNDLIFLYNLRKSLICVSTFTLFLTALDILNSLYMIIPFCLVLLGCFGFCYYNKWLSLGYILFNIGKIGTDIYFIFNTHDYWIIFLLTITILIELYLIELTSRFCIRLWYLSSIKLNTLKDNYKPARYYVVFY
jgi:hypothetical protein